MEQSRYGAGIVSSEEEKAVKIWRGYFYWSRGWSSQEMEQVLLLVKRTEQSRYGRVFLLEERREQSRNGACIVTGGED